MKTMKRKFFSMALLAGLTLCTAACNDDDNNGNGNTHENGDGEIATLSGSITKT